MKLGIQGSEWGERNSVIEREREMMRGEREWRERVEKTGEEERERGRERETRRETMREWMISERRREIESDTLFFLYFQ